MRRVISLLFLCGAVLAETKCERHALNTTLVTEIGTWDAEMEHCPEGTYATGMQIKYQDKQRKGDNTALNGVRFFCNKLNGEKQSTNTMITSAVGPWGQWQKVQWCPPGLVINGYEFLQTKYNPKGDNIGIVSIAAYCGFAFGKRTVGSYIQGKHDQSGAQWGGYRFCNSSHVVCGFQSRIHSGNKRGDYQGLTNGNFDCCKVKEEEVKCTPTVQQETVFTFENTKLATGVSVSYTIKQAFNRTIDSAKPDETEKNLIGTHMRAVAKKLAASYNFLVGKGKETEESIKGFINDAINKSNEKSYTVQVPWNKKVAVKQYTIQCGGYRVGLPTIIQA